MIVIVTSNVCLRHNSNNPSTTDDDLDCLGCHFLSAIYIPRKVGLQNELFWMRRSREQLLSLECIWHLSKCVTGWSTASRPAPVINVINCVSVVSVWRSRLALLLALVLVTKSILYFLESHHQQSSRTRTEKYLLDNTSNMEEDKRRNRTELVNNEWSILFCFHPVSELDLRDNNQRRPTHMVVYIDIPMHMKKRPSMCQLVLRSLLSDSESKKQHCYRVQ